MKGDSRSTPALNPFLSRKDGATELYLIRHADALPEDSEELEPASTYETRPLSKLGQTQARKLAAYFNDTKFDFIYSSPLLRTRQTAAPLSEMQGLPVEIVADLREIELYKGEPAPVDAQAMRMQLDKAVQMAAQVGYWSAVESAEPGHVFRARIVNAVDAIASKHSGQRVAVVTHGGSINIYIADLLGLERDFFFPIINTSFSIVRVGAQNKALVSLNNIYHLKSTT